MEIKTVKDYGAWGDGDSRHADEDTRAFRLALEQLEEEGENPARWISIPAGTYYINETLVYRTDEQEAPGLTLFGAGMYNTILVNRVFNGPLLRLEGGRNTSQTQKGGRIADFSIVRTPLSMAIPSIVENQRPRIVVPSTVESHRIPGPSIAISPKCGIEFRSVWHCDVERIRIEGLEGSGIQVGSYADARRREGGDSDSSAYLRFKNCIFKQNGYGMNFISAPRTLGIAQVSIEDSDITGNASGGIRGDGVGIFTVRGCDIYTNGRTHDDHGGIHICYNGENSQVVIVENCNLGKSNYPASIWLETSICGEISRNRFVRGESDRDTKGVYIGPPASPDGNGFVYEFACRQNWFDVEFRSNHDEYVIGNIYNAFHIEDIIRNFYIEKTRFSNIFSSRPSKRIEKLLVGDGVNSTWYDFDDRSRFIDE
jgi:hypothetical protein